MKPVLRAAVAIGIASVGCNLVFGIVDPGKPHFADFELAPLRIVEARDVVAVAMRADHDVCALAPAKCGEVVEYLSRKLF